MELDRLEKAANNEMRKTLPRFRYNGEVADTLLGDLAEVVTSKHWRGPLKRTADNLRRASKNIHDGVGCAVRAANSCPTCGTIPAIVWESTADAKAERKRIGALPVQDRLFGNGGAIESLWQHQRRPVFDPKKAAPGFLRAMLDYAARLEHEAIRIEGILKTRNRHFDRLGPMLNLIRDVERLTGKPNDAAVARLLADAHEAIASTKQFSPDAIRKLRERHLVPQA